MGERGKRPKPVNYGPIAEKRVDNALARLVAEGEINFWFRAPPHLDAEGIDHIFGKSEPVFSVWVVQVTCGKKKRRTYYKRVVGRKPSSIKAPYRRRQYYRYIPLLFVNRRISDLKIRKKLRNISGGFKSIFVNKSCPAKVKIMIKDFLASKGIAVPAGAFEVDTRS